MSTGFDPSAFLARCSRRPGVYRMLDADGQVLYVGKARDLRARLGSYFGRQQDSIKTRALVTRVASVETTVTATEAEALLLEQALIKELRPPYNILLRDDKSYPYIRVTTGDTWPRIAFHRGARRGRSTYFGPYPDSGAVRETLNTVEKVFQLRNCSDSYFRNRSRPCLQYQIQRCTGPCVGLVSEETYREQVNLALDFLAGRDEKVTDVLASQMNRAAAEQRFERAAELRDQIASIRSIQQKQYMDTGRGNVDVLAVACAGGQAVVEQMPVREGRVLSPRSHFPRIRGDESETQILEAFLGQYYLSAAGPALPGEIILDREIEGPAGMKEALSRHAGRKIRLSWSVRGERRGWQRMAVDNAMQALVSRQADRDTLERRVEALRALLSLDGPPARIECFDISHTGGERAVASCVVFEQGEARRDQYRRFNVAPEREGDDYAALAEAVRRRYRRLSREGSQPPDLVLIDGGAGQLSAVAEVLEDIPALEETVLLAISKGPARRPGQEVLHRVRGAPLSPAADNPGLHLLQQVRDEAHRFALAGHRARRGKVRRASLLEEIPGVGPNRRQQLLQYFGGLERLRDAGVEELASAPGISRKLAEVIYDWLHE